MPENDVFLVLSSVTPSVEDALPVEDPDADDERNATPRAAHSVDQSPSGLSTPSVAGDDEIPPTETSPVAGNLPARPSGDYSFRLPCACLAALSVLVCMPCVTDTINRLSGRVPRELAAGQGQAATGQQLPAAARARVRRPLGARRSQVPGACSKSTQPITL